MASVTIPAGAEYVSDPVGFAAAAGSDITVSIHYPRPPARQTGHPGSRATSFVARGNRVGDADLHRAIPVEHWYQLADIAGSADRPARANATIGDSTTHGHGTTTPGAHSAPDP